MPTCLHAKTPVVHKEDKICPLPVPSFKQLELGFVSRRFCNISIQAKFHCHSTRLNKNSEMLRLIYPVVRTYPIYIHVRLNNFQFR